MRSSSFPQCRWKCMSRRVVIDVNTDDETLLFPVRAPPPPPPRRVSWHADTRNSLFHSASRTKFLLSRQIRRPTQCLNVLPPSSLPIINSTRLLKWNRALPPESDNSQFHVLETGEIPSCSLNTEFRVLPLDGSFSCTIIRHAEFLLLCGKIRMNWMENVWRAEGSRARSRMRQQGFCWTSWLFLAWVEHERILFKIW